MGLSLDWLEVLKTKGLIDAPAEEIDDSPFIPVLFVPPGTLTLPIETASEANGRDWKARSNRNKEARRIVAKEIGCRWEFFYRFPVAYHRGEKLKLIFTRLGGRRLDKANVGAALKATEDAVALLFGANDGDDRWDAEFEQQPGGLKGVRIEIYTTGEHGK